MSLINVQPCSVTAFRKQNLTLRLVLDSRAKVKQKNTSCKQQSSKALTILLARKKKGVKAKHCLLQH